ncbi:hypothetical protein QUB68_09100 [Microcoleus sp. A006_D1]
MPQLLSLWEFCLGDRSAFYTYGGAQIGDRAIPAQDSCAARAC